MIYIEDVIYDVKNQIHLITKNCMVILCIFTGKGFNQQMYEQIRKEIDWEHNHPTGEIFHAVGFDKSGDIHVTDIWQSEEDFNKFLESKLKPALEKINAPMPIGGVYPIYNINVFQGLESYRVK
jgi:hypothetical protein